MIAAIKDFISNMFAHTTKQSDVIETLAVTATGIGKDSPDTYAVYERQIDTSITGTEYNTRTGTPAREGKDTN